MMKLRQLCSLTVVLYVFFGILTTAVNVCVFYVLRKAGVFIDVSVAAAWFISVLFAFLTNRKFVFHSRNEGVLRELILFFCSRLFSGAVDFILMHLLSRQEFMNEVILKILVNLIVIILNYVLSRFIVFSHKKNGGDF